MGSENEQVLYYFNNMPDNNNKNSQLQLLYALYQYSCPWLRVGGLII